MGAICALINLDREQQGLKLTFVGIISGVIKLRRL